MSATVEPMVTPGRIRRVLRVRRLWFALGLVLGLCAALAYLQIVPTVYQSTAVVNITAVSTDPAAAGKAPSSVLDMPTELQLASSAITADLAAETLGEGWDSSTLRQGVEVKGDSDGTIVSITYSDTDKDRAMQGADALASSYLQVRTLLVTERVAAVGSSLDQQMENLRTQLADQLQQGAVSEDDAAQSQASAAEETTRIMLQTLANRRVALTDVSSVAGQVITPAAANKVTVLPPRRTVVAAGLMGGLFLGLLLVLARQAVARRPADNEEIEDMLGVQVWLPEASIGRTSRWASVAEMVAWAVADSPSSAAVLADLGGPDSRAAAASVAQAADATVIDLRRARQRVLRAMRGRGAVVLVATPAWTKARFERVSRDISAVGCELVGVMLAARERPQSLSDQQATSSASADSGLSADSAADTSSAVSATSAASTVSAAGVVSAASTADAGRPAGAPGGGAEPEPAEVVTPATGRTGAAPVAQDAALTEARDTEGDPGPTAVRTSLARLRASAVAPAEPASQGPASEPVITPTVPSAEPVRTSPSPLRLSADSVATPAEPAGDLAEPGTRMIDVEEVPVPRSPGRSAPSADRAAKPAAKQAAKPVATPAAKPAAKPAATPVTKAAAKPAAKAAAKPVAKPGATPATKAAAKPAAKPGATPAVKPAVSSSAASAGSAAAAPAAKPAAKPATASTAQPGTKPAAGPAAKPAARPAHASAARQAAKPSAEPAATPATAGAVSPASAGSGEGDPR
ncbi:GumC domain-containing protein [Actinomyces howellii]|uniref:Capsular polysaccharide biosynthesis protein n=1 Tax=Actinomyces howellii TaxID=52771 RepID=A0A3S4TAX5_9ACTO|nr:hypothetical protein [Actinomyces howellii]VEG29535.1 Capsular polysaccharide biosynthesis protein [Actinomyces howellii]